jgi:pyrroloquinoline quinone (PQQ) biosynthesis protein C
MTATLNPTTELLSHDDFRAALQDAIKGREAKNASFSKAWAEGKLERHHFARWAENHYQYVGPSPTTWASSTRTPGHLHRGQGLPAPEHVRGGARRHPPHRPAHPLRRGVRHDP